MKIVCDACQAKYSIADEKIQGKAFKIRCKKCNHIIVVKVGEGGAVASSGIAATDKPRATGSLQAARSPVPATRPVGGDQAVWHVVIDGEQVGPLAESEIKDRLRQGKVNSDTLVWKEGFGDWTQFSAVPELTPLLARITHHPVAAAKPARPSGPRAAVSAPAAVSAAAEGDDPFAAPTVVSPAGTADIFAAAMAPAAAAPVAAPPTAAPAASASPFLFGGAPTQPEPLATRPSGGNGAGGTHLTGQRNENSVLFSLANLEALAVPTQSPGIRPPSASGNTEGSGLIDIRSMAAMTLNDGGSSERARSADALPTFSTPQFSPVAPVLLPMSMSGPPKWVYPVLVMLAIAITAVGITIYRVASKPPPGLPPPPPPPAPAAPAVAASAAAPAAPAAPAAAPAGGAAQAPAAAPEEKPADKAKTPTARSDKGRRKGSESSGAGRASGDTKRGSEAAAAADDASKGARKGAGGRSLDDLLGEVGTKKAGAAAEPAKPAVKLVTLTQSDIVSAMKGVQPKVQACANQFKVPGTAMATISVASGGRVASATVTGKFAGTPTGSCVGAAAKSARFPPCQAMTFPWPFTLSPR